MRNADHLSGSSSCERGGGGLLTRLSSLKSLCYAAFLAAVTGCDGTVQVPVENGRAAAVERDRALLDTDVELGHLQGDLSRIDGKLASEVAQLREDLKGKSSKEEVTDLVRKELGEMQIRQRVEAIKAKLAEVEKRLDKLNEHFGILPPPDTPWLKLPQNPKEKTSTAEQK